MNDFAGKTALVTGASAGLGEEFALQLAQRGVTRLALTARRADRLEALRERLLAAHPGIEVTIHPGDLSAPGAAQQLAAGLEPPDILINNAGFGDLGVFETSDPERMEAMIALNIAALTRLTRWVIPALLERRAGWICNVGSTAGLLPLPSFAVYGATKAYVNSFTEAVRVELHGTGIHVIALCPGPVETEFGQVATRPDGKRAFAPPKFFCEPAAEVVRETLDALAFGQGRIIPGLAVRLLMLLAESTPRFLLRLIFTAMSGQFRRERAAR
jgi:short-subunit dehydrogenase